MPLRRLSRLQGRSSWRKVPIWKDVSTEYFMSYRWSVS